MYVDSHAHLGDDSLFPHFEEITRRAFDAQVEAIVNICTNKTTLERGLLMKNKEPKIFLTAATTPHDVEAEGESFFVEVEKAAQNKSLVAIGETGLDYYYEHSPKELQKKYLLRYFHLAKKMQLPIVFHCREAFEDLFYLADEEYKAFPALLHCFTGTLAEAKKVLDRGWYISFSGIVTFKKSEMLREVVQYVPLDRMLIETDAPYLAPQKRRGSLNEPSFILETAEVISQIKQIPLESLARQTRDNTAAFFSF